MFVHLRVKSDYSLLESALKIDRIIDLCVANRMPAIAINDSGNLAGALEFSEKAIKKGVQPIISCEVNLAFAGEAFKVLLLVQSHKGYLNLMHLVSESFLVNDQIIDVSQFDARSEGLICVSGGLVAKFLSHPSVDPSEVVGCLKGVFRDRFYIELQRYQGGDLGESLALSLASQHQLPLLATNNVLFATQDMYEAHDALLCIKHGRCLPEPDRVTSNPEFYFKSAEDMCAAFADLPEAIENSVFLAKRCAFVLEPSAPKLPKYSCALPEDEELKKQAISGLEDRFAGKEVPAEYQARLDGEVAIICNMNYAGYFLIVSDFTKWSKNNGIPIGPGRGSGVGSLVAWSLRITEVDPIIYGLIFERFLNPDRVSMPDFDIDFCQEKRDLVIDYIRRQYGHVAHIITFGKLQPRAVIRDVGRVMQIPYGQLDAICKAIPHNPINPVGLAEAIELDEDLQRKRGSDKAIQQLLDLSLKLEGLYRHASVHAAGIVISSEPLTDTLPLFYEEGTNLPITQYSMKYVEKAGLIKFDFLGLKTLTTIAKTYESIGLDPSTTIPVDDTKTYQNLSKGDSIGVFQLENRFMQDVLQKLKPDRIEDIIALISLNRPGPMSNIPTYIGRKHGVEAVDYPDPCLEGILKETFGVIIYQEQVMQMAQVLAGYTMSAADLLRRSMGKKIKSEMDKQRGGFIEGAIANGVDREKAVAIFLLVEKFAGYGFNKSHAAAYAMISFETAYLKAHYPLHFLVALMNTDIQSTDKLNQFFYDAKKHKIELLPPDINKSRDSFAIEGNAIRYGLGAIKNVGIGAAASIISRDYNSLWDFARGFDGGLVNRKVLEGLIHSGALDGLHDNRKQLIESVDQLIAINQKIREMPTQNTLFEMEDGIMSSHAEEYDWTERMNKQFECLGVYVDGHPLEPYANLIKYIKGKRIFGVLTSVRMRSAGHSKFANIAITTPDTVEWIAFYDEKIINGARDCLAVGNLVAVEFSDKGFSGKIGHGIRLLRDFLLSHLKRLAITIREEKDVDFLLCALKKGGRIKVELWVNCQGRKVAIELDDGYDLDIDALTQLGNMFELAVI